MSVMVLTCLVQVHAESVPENANENLKMDVKVADVIPVADDNNDDDDDDDDNDNSLQRASAGLSICKGFCRFGCRKTCKRCSYVCKKYGWKKCRYSQVCKNCRRCIHLKQRLCRKCK